MSDGPARTDPAILPDLPAEWTVSLDIRRTLPDGAGEYVIMVGPSRKAEHAGQYVVSASINGDVPMTTYADTLADALETADLGHLVDQLDAYYLEQLEAYEARQAAVNGIFGDGWRRA